MHSIHLSYLTGPIVMNFNRFRQRPLAYTVSYVTLTVGTQEVEPASVIRDVRDKTLKDLALVSPVRVIVERTIWLGRHQGQELVLEAIRRTGWRMRIYVVDGRYYILKVFGSIDQVQSPAADRFFESFSVSD
jgi:hypothetical protein